MKAFKGCTNPECKVYKKVHYKKNDEYCLKCGKPLSFVCAECWKPMEEGKDKYCVSCSAKKEQNRAQKVATVKKYGSQAVVLAGTAVVSIPRVIKNSDKIVKDEKKVVDAAGDIVKMVKK